MRPLLSLLRQGVTPEKLALSVALGIAIGLAPVLGFASVLCLAAIPLRLNCVAFQLVNYLVYPLQIAMLVPFIRMEQWLFAAQPLTFSAARMLSSIGHGDWTAVCSLWGAAMHAAVAWLLLGAVAVIVMYFLLLPPLRKHAKAPVETAPQEWRPTHDDRSLALSKTSACNPTSPMIRTTELTLKPGASANAAPPLGALAVTQAPAQTGTN